jgi:CheY-like chemotaxis protein
MRSMQHCGMDKNEMATVQNQLPRRRIGYSDRPRSEVEPDQPATPRRSGKASGLLPGIGEQGDPDGDVIVFVIDDDESVRQSLSNLVRSAGLRVKVFASAEEFLCYKHPDVAGVLVLDVHPPRLSGFDLQPRMSETAFQIPIIFTTEMAPVCLRTGLTKQSNVPGFSLKPAGREAPMGTRIR